MSRREVVAEVTGSVWKVLVGTGDVVVAGGVVMILESMKMEIPVIAEDGGTVVELLVAEGAAVTEGQPVAVLDD
ncbi:MAG TPA: biotin/lipoyl-binding carrier protein [Acidimicrobiia bacterium]|nr:biotin/lipoyl-binding carrier protein [Acidimicrobiia bacterium]